MLFIFFPMSLQTLEILLNKNKYRIFKLSMDEIFPKTLDKRNNPEHLIIKNYRDSKFFKLSKTLNRLFPSQYKFSDEKDDGEIQNNKISLSHHLSFVEFIINFVEQIFNESEINKSEYYYSKFLNDFIQKIILPETKEKNIINYLYYVFDFFDFNYLVKIQFLRMIFIFSKENDIFDIKNLNFIIFDRDFELIINNFSKIFIGKDVDFENWDENISKYYDSIVFECLKNINRDYHNNISLHISQKLQEINLNINVLLEFKYLDTLYIHDTFSLFNLLSSISNNTYLNLKNLKLIFSNDEILPDIHYNSLLFGILESFSYVGLSSNFDTGLRFFKSLPQITELHLKFKINTPELETHKFIDNLIQFINTKKIEIIDLNIDLQHFDNILNQLKNNKFIQVLYLTADYMKYKDFLHFKRNDFTNLKCLIIKSNKKINENFINEIKNKINCLIQLTEDINQNKIFHFKALKNKYDLEFINLYKKENNISIIILENVNLVNINEIFMILNLEIENLQIKNSNISISLFKRLYKSRLKENLKSISFENIKIFNLESYFKNKNKIDLEYLKINSMDFPDKIIENILKQF